MLVEHVGWAFKTVNYDRFGPFIMPLLELRLDQANMFKWQQYTQGTKEVPHYQVLLDFLDLRTQAFENIIFESDLKR